MCLSYVGWIWITVWCIFILSFVTTSVQPITYVCWNWRKIYIRELTSSGELRLLSLPQVAVSFRSWNCSGKSRVHPYSFLLNHMTSLLRRHKFNQSINQSLWHCYDRLNSTDRTKLMHRIMPFYLPIFYSFFGVLVCRLRILLIIYETRKTLYTPVVFLQKTMAIYFSFYPILKIVPFSKATLKTSFVGMWLPTNGTPGGGIYYNSYQ